MLGFSAYIETLKRHGIWDATSYIAGVSGSCWTIATLYTTCSLSTRALLMHWSSMARERLHPMSRKAFDVVARTSRGTYFLIAPLLRKAQSGIVGLGVMDLYAVIVTVSGCSRTYLETVTLTRVSSPGLPAAAAPFSAHLWLAEPATLQMVFCLVEVCAFAGQAPFPNPVRCAHQPFYITKSSLRRQSRRNLAGRSKATTI
jgi:Lysophospholipase catalytic domain